MTEAERKTVSGRCRCGSQYEITGSPEYLRMYEKDFWRSHKGEKHGPEDPLPDPGTQGSLL